MRKTYSVVGFIEEAGQPVEVIPSIWLKDDDKICLWPPGDRTKIRPLIMKCVPPNEDFKEKSIKLYGSSNSVVNAGKKAEEALILSSLDSDSSEDENSVMKKRISVVPARYKNMEEEDQSQSLLENVNPKILKAKKSKAKKNSQKNDKYALPNPPSDDDERENSFKLIQISNSRNIKKDGIPPFSSLRTDDTPSEHINKQNEKRTLQNEENVLLRNSNIVLETSMTHGQDTLEQDSYDFLHTATAEVNKSQGSFTHKDQKDIVLENILKHLIEIKKENKLLKKEMRSLREKVELKLQADENPKVVDAISNIVNFENFENLPLNSLDDLRSLEEEITQDSSKATSLARFLCRGGGFRNFNALTLLVIKRLFSRNVAMLYSVEGRQEKLKFSDLNLFNVVVASVKMKYEDAEITAINSRIGRVLSGAADWDGNRSRGKRKRTVSDEENRRETCEETFSKITNYCQDY